MDEIVLTVPTSRNLGLSTYLPVLYTVDYLSIVGTETFTIPNLLITFLSYKTPPKKSRKKSRNTADGGRKK